MAEVVWLAVYYKKGETAMKNLITAGEDYIKKMDMADVGLLKICLFSMGLFSGICVTKENKKKVGFWAMVIYIITFIPLMSKFFRIYKEQE
ncbi:MAG: permease of phosphate ABC transporter [Peptostreptococcaceae bacterium]|nr:permease of phosphate ABC transporter [Peptostreptococcaceae bacterium]